MSKKAFFHKLRESGIEEKDLTDAHEQLGARIADYNDAICERDIHGFDVTSYENNHLGEEEY